MYNIYADMYSVVYDFFIPKENKNIVKIYIYERGIHRTEKNFPIVEFYEA